MKSRQADFTRAFQIWRSATGHAQSFGEHQLSMEERALIEKLMPELEEVYPGAPLPLKPEPPPLVYPGAPLPLKPFVDPGAPLPLKPEPKKVNRHLVTRHQRGYIYEASGAFFVRYYTVVDGVRKQLSHKLCTKDRATGCGSPSAKAVRQLCEDFMRTVNTDTPAPAALTVVEFWNTTYLPFVTDNLKHSTVWGYKQVWNQHLKNHFGKGLLKDYRTPTMSLFLTSLAKSLKPRTLNTVKCLASGLFAHAVATGHCETNPIRDAMVLGKTLQNGETKSYSLEEAEQIINALVEHPMCQVVMALAFFAGLRKGEIQGLQWEDFGDGVVHVRRAFGRGVLGTPKSRKSVRIVPVIAPLRRVLTGWASLQAGEVPSGWVFPSPRGEALGMDGVAKATIKPALKRAGVPWKGFHACRRGLGTELRAITGNSNAGQNVLGHSSPHVTQQHYEHAMPEEALRGMKLLEEKVGK